MKNERAKKLIADTSEWDFDLLQRYDQEIGRIAAGFNLDTYPNQIEIISSEQMMDAYSMIGMPVNYNHWSFGKKFLHTEKNYKRGNMGLAYEIVINSNPCIAYLMEENTATMQALVIAHACYGHNSFFKNNYLFKTWTNADAIVDYLLFAKNYISQCEERYGDKEVERTLDACHALMNHGVDRYQRPQKLSLGEERERQENRAAYLQSQINDLWRTIPIDTRKKEKTVARFPAEPEENILYFLEKHSPLLEPWQREVVRIVRKIGQYFYPQRQTQVMNEGWACFWHYTILNSMYDEGLVSDQFMIEFLQSHTNVIYQPEFDSPYYSGINPYALGFNMMLDIRRICEMPTEEDKHWFPDLVHSDWNKSLDFAMRNFKDESFIAQFLSPTLIRKFKLFALLDDEQQKEIEISAIHDEQGYREIRRALAAQYNLGNVEPNIQVYNVNHRSDRALTLRHMQFDRKPLNKSAQDVLKHLHYLWGFEVKLETVNTSNKVLSDISYPRTRQDKESS